MMPKWHFTLGLIFSSILYAFNFSLIEISLFFLASFFIIDLDHIPYFILKERSINPIKFYEWSNERKERWSKFSKKKKAKYKKPIFFFHNLETLGVLFVLSFFYQTVLFILFGFFSHLICDLLGLHYKEEEKYYRISLIYTLIKNKNKRRLE